MPQLSRASAYPVLAVLAVAAAPHSLLPTYASPTASGLQDVALVDRPFVCASYPQPLRLGTVKVTITPDAPRPYDAIELEHGDCSGSIQRIEVDTWVSDGVKMGESTHDLTIGGGYVYCHDRRVNPDPDGASRHQDGIQAMGGTNVTFNNLIVFCGSANHSAFFLSKGADGSDSPAPGDWPTDVVCDNCLLVGGASTVQIGDSIDSGVVDSVVAHGHLPAGAGPDGIRIGAGAVDPVDLDDVAVPCLVPFPAGDEGAYCPTANPRVQPPINPR